MAPQIFRRNVIGSHSGRLVKWKGTVASIAPGFVVAAVSVLGPVGKPALAQTIGGTETTPQSVAADGVLTIVGTGSLTVTDQIIVTAIDVTGPFTGTISHAGSITAKVTDGRIPSGVFWVTGATGIDIDGGVDGAASSASARSRSARPGILPRIPPCGSSRLGSPCRLQASRTAPTSR